jgi:hypothetical protein
MSDPMDDRIRAYYRSIEAEPPVRLMGNVARAIDRASAPVPHRLWRPAFALAAAGTLVIVLGLVVRGLMPGPLPSASPAVAESPSQPVASPTGVTSPTPSPSPPPTATPTPTPTPTPTAVAPLPTGTFGPAYSNSIGRNFYTATLLKDGRVLVAGGLGTGDGGPIGRLAVAQIWDPSTGKFTATGSMNLPRYQHTATLLEDGRVLIVGGADMSDGYDNLASAELYDPATGKFTLTRSMAVGRARQTATLLPDGRVLIAGGANTVALAEAEVYDPATGVFTVTGSMATSRERASATLLGGQVLAAGGLGSTTPGGAGVALSSAEIYDPATGSFRPTEPMNEARYDQAAAIFSDQAHPSAAYVLLAGGTGASGQALDTAEVFDPSRDNFGSTRPMSAARGTPTATFVLPGYVLVIGGPATSATADLFDPATGDFATVGRAGAGAGQTATRLSTNCSVLLSGPGGKAWELFRLQSCVS